MVVECFARRYAEKAGKQISKIDKITLKLCQSYHWPGNIRELQNIVERSVILCTGDTFWIDEAWLASQGAPRLESSGPLTQMMFVRVIEKGSFSAVAKERGIGQPAVSKQISALEDEFGAELIHRTSRSIALTEAGRDLYESALRILDDFENATSRIGRGQTAPKGLIRVTVPPTFARLHIVSKLPAFFAAYPDMAVELGASESPTTIIEDGFDLASHSGDLPDSTLVARRVAHTTTILVATPQYVTRFGAPESPRELNRFPSVVCIEHGSVRPW